MGDDAAAPSLDARLDAEARALAEEAGVPRRALRVWVDLDNLPHVPVFRPLIGLLRRRGHEVLVTARRHAFTIDLLKLHGIEHTVVGAHPGKALWRKVTGTLGRAWALRGVARRWGADVAVAHGSRSAAVAARMARVPALTMFDYEHVHAGVFLRCCRAILLPSELPPESLPADLRAAEGSDANAGARPGRARVGRFPGFKEQLYLDLHAPDATLRARLPGAAGRVVVLLREPASTAHYHAPESDRLFEAALEWLRDQGDAALGVMLPRREAGGARRDVPPNLHVLEKPVDGLDLLCASDLAISGGGTMNREAALLGVPTYSIFRGTPGALDARLAAMGRLTIVDSVDAVRAIPCAPRAAAPAPPDGRAARAAVLAAIERLAR